MTKTPTKAPPPRTRATLLQRLRTYFLTGIVVTAPIAITVYVTWAFIHSIDQNITPLIPERYNPETYLPFNIPGLGVIVVVIALTVLGALFANFLGRFLIRTGEKIVDRMPIVRSIYSTLKQIFETVVASKSDSFQDVVLVEYPRKGLWAIAFITSATKGEVHRVMGREMINVFLPTTPNPTSGFLLFVPKEDLVYLNMTVEEGIRKVISAGLVTPPDHGPVAPEPAEPITPSPITPNEDI
jgi:uncharacterized membrane protein